MNSSSISWSHHAIFRLYQRFIPKQYAKILNTLNEKNMLLSESSFFNVALSYKKARLKLKNILKCSREYSPCGNKKTQYLISDPKFEDNQYFVNKNLNCVFLIREDVVITTFSYNPKDFC